MHVFFGPGHDARHIEPTAPGGYEWWYYDALSDDGKTAVVVIFFLGAPMSVYYRNVLLGRGDAAQDWCGVFATIHRRKSVEKPWRQIFYSYNLYPKDQFLSPGGFGVPEVGRHMIATSPSNSILLDERSYYNSNTLYGSLEFTKRTVVPALETISVLGNTERHFWSCSAPTCSVTVALHCGHFKTGFRGTGYHDHNWGTLPFDDVEIWYWGRAHVRGDDGQERTVIFYHLEPTDSAKPAQTECYVVHTDGTLQVIIDATATLQIERTHIYGLRHAEELRIEDEIAFSLTAVFDSSNSLANGPFYRRLPFRLDVRGDGWNATNVEGIGEVFRPSRLGGPLVSFATWARIRRRSM